MARGNEHLTARLGAVVDPVLFHSLDELGTLDSAREHRRGVEVVVASPLAVHPGAEELRARLSDALEGRAVDLSFRHLSDEERAALGEHLRELEGATPVAGAHAPGPGAGNVRANPFTERRSATRVLAVGSGKGGVGKSTVTVNLAVALAATGRSVGLLDADIYGFSVPRMLGVDYPPILLGKTIVPPAAHGVRCISMGFFAEEDKAVAWRGPMLHKALEQFLVDVHWGRLDFLVVDMPPGTGDVALSVAQQLPSNELYVVTTPQPAAQRVAQRAAALGRQLRIPVRGVIENMSYFLSPGGERFELFGSGGGETLAADLKVPLLAQIPLIPELRGGGDEGVPAAALGGEAAAIFEALAKRLIEAGPARLYRAELTIS